MTTGILPFCLRDLIGEDQYSTLSGLCYSMGALAKRQISEDQLDEFDRKLQTYLALIERDFPVTLQVKFAWLTLWFDLKNSTITCIMLYHW